MTEFGPITDLFRQPRGGDWLDVETRACRLRPLVRIAIMKSPVVRELNRSGARITASIDAQLLAAGGRPVRLPAERTEWTAARPSWLSPAARQPDHDDR